MDAIARAVTPVWQAHPGVLSAYIFGSHATGRPHRESDLDVAVLLDRGVYPTARARFDARLRLTGDLGRAAGCPPIDLVVLNDVPPTLARAILNGGRRIFCRNAEADHACLRTTLLRAADLDLFLRRTRAIKLGVLRR